MSDSWLISPPFEIVAVLYFLYKLWIGLVFWTTLLVLYPIFRVLLSNENWFGLAFRLKQKWARCFQLLIFCPIQIERSAKLPDGPFLIVSNHASYLDTVFMYLAFSRYFLFVGKSELLKWPLFNLFFQKMDIPVSRTSAFEANKSMLKVLEALKKGNPVAIYPEGTIPPEAPKLGEFKNGAFKIAQRAGVPVVPVTIVNSVYVLKDATKLFEKSRPVRIKIIVHSPISYAKDETLLQFKNRVFLQIDSALPKVLS